MSPVRASVGYFTSLSERLRLALFGAIPTAQEANVSQLKSKLTPYGVRRWFGGESELGPH